MSASPYGTFDQGGNAFEWNETMVTNSSRGVRGGSFNDRSLYLQASFRPYDDPSNGGFSVGFRVASISEPCVPGDYNGNGIVDAADHVLWRKGGPLLNEVDNPGTVNAADYAAWRQRFGNPNPGSGSSFDSTNVPEPAPLTLIVAGISGLLSCRRKSIPPNRSERAPTGRLDYLIPA